MPKATAQKKTWITKSLRKAYEAHMASLPDDRNYDLLEELPSGTIINHLYSVPLDELKSYVRMVFIDSAPPSFIIRPTISTESKPKNPLIQLFRRLTNA